MGLEASDDYLAEVAALMHDRVTKAEELATFCAYFYADPSEYEDKGVKKRWKDDSAELVRAYADALEADDTFTVESTEATLREITEATRSRSRTPDPPGTSGRQRHVVRPEPVRHARVDRQRRRRETLAQSGRCAGLTRSDPRCSAVIYNDATG